MALEFTSGEESTGDESTLVACSTIWSQNLIPILNTQIPESERKLIEEQWIRILAPCMGPAGINKSISFVGGINITLGVVVSAGIGFFIGQKLAKKKAAAAKSGG